MQDSPAQTHLHTHEVTNQPAARGDLDLLDEQARDVLGLLRGDEIVIR